MKFRTSAMGLALIASTAGAQQAPGTSSVQLYGSMGAAMTHRDHLAGGASIN